MVPISLLNGVLISLVKCFKVTFCNELHDSSKTCKLFSSASQLNKSRLLTLDTFFSNNSPSNFDVLMLRYLHPFSRIHLTNFEETLYIHRFTFWSCRRFHSIRTLQINLIDLRLQFIFCNLFLTRAFLDQAFNISIIYKDLIPFYKELGKEEIFSVWWLSYYLENIGSKIDRSSC